MTTTVRTDERLEFLGDLFIGAMGHDGSGFFWLAQYYAPSDKTPASWYAEITEKHEPGDEFDEFRVDVETIEKGLDVIRTAVLRQTPVKVFRQGTPYEYTIGGEFELHNAETGEVLYISEALREAVMAADRANDAAGDGEHEDLDVVAYLAILECGLYGKVVFT